MVKSKELVKITKNPHWKNIKPHLDHEIVEAFECIIKVFENLTEFDKPSKEYSTSRIVLLALLKKIQEYERSKV